MSISARVATCCRLRRRERRTALSAVICVAFFTPPDDDLEYVICGDPLDVQRRVGRNELLDSVLPHGLDLRKHVETLRRVAIELEMGDEAAIRQARKKEDDDG